MKASSYTLLADEVLTLDARGMTYSPGAVVIEGDSISYVGPPQAEKSGTVIHLEWLQARMRPLETLVGPSELRAGALAGCLELLTSGVTTIADRYSEMGEVAGAVEESGLRAVLAHSLYDSDAERGLREAEALLGRFGADPARSRVWAGVGPHATDSCGPDLLRRVAALAERSGARIFIHLAQAEAEVAAVRARGYAGCAAYLDELGLLAPTVVVAHGTYLTDGEADLVGRRGTAVVADVRPERRVPASGCTGR